MDEYKCVENDIVDNFHQNLISQQAYMDHLQKTQGFNLETIKKNKIGFNSDNKRITFPIYQDNKCINIIQYNRKQENKYTWYETKSNGFNCNILLGKEHLVAGNTVVMVNGFKSWMIANQYGFNAICSSLGEQFNKDWVDLFKDVEVLIPYDNDPTGKRFADRVEKLVSPLGTVLKIDLSSVCKEEKEDFQDYLVKYKKTKEDFEQVSYAVKEKSKLKIVSSQIRKEKNQIPKMSPKGFYGLFPELLHDIKNYTEAAPEAIYINSLILLGNIMGESSSIYIGAGHHSPILFGLHIAPSNSGRKGEAVKAAKIICKGICLSYDYDINVMSGARSGEGIIESTKDREPSDTDTYSTANNNDNRRLFVETEIASVFKVASQPGNILSPILRKAWDGETLQLSTRKNSIKSTNPHISLIGNITPLEFDECTTTVDIANGLLNRFVYCTATRKKRIVDGKSLSLVNLDKYREQFKTGIETTSKVEEYSFTDEAKKLWKEWYLAIPEDESSVYDVIICRGAPQVLRIALILARLHSFNLIEKEHLESAFAVWDYSCECARQIFGDSLSDETANKILIHLEHSPEGASKTDLHGFFHRNKTKADLNKSINLLIDLGKVVEEKNDNGQIIYKLTNLTNSTN